MSKSILRMILAVFCLSLILGTTACAKSQTQDVARKTQEISDPIEPINRFVFGFNDVLDKVLIDPVARGYNAVIPSFIRNSIQNFMHNLKSPLVIANNLLQGDIENAGNATARFIVNSTIGVAGLVDVAKEHGLPYEGEDFGQTLATWGIGDGFYLVLPILGPSSMRDAVGIVADAAADPVRIVTLNTNHEWIYYTRNAIEGLDNRSRIVKAVNDLRRNSLDYYAAVRSTYSQRRTALIRDEKPGSTTQAMDYNSLQ